MRSSVKKQLASLVILQASIVLLCVSVACAQRARFYVEVDVFGSSGGDYGTAMSFIDAIDLKGLGSIQLPVTGYVDPETLMKFLPPALKGSMAHVETTEGPEVADDMLVGYAHVIYFREATHQGTWDQITVDIIDAGKSGGSRMRGSHLDSRYKKYTESTKIKGYEATVFRGTDASLELYEHVQITLAIPPAETQIEWISVSVAALEGTRKGVQLWALQAKFTTGFINGPWLTIPPGCLEGPNFEASIVSEMKARGVPEEIAQAFATPVWLGWRKWSLTFNIPSIPAFPAFAAFPGPYAPLMPALPISLSAASSNRDLLRAESLKRQILGRLGKWEKDPDARKAVERFTQWFDERFTLAVTTSWISNLYGQGPVPTFAPPYIPVGPVVQGRLTSTPGAFARLQF